MEMTLSNYIDEVMKGYKDGKVLSVKIDKADYSYKGLDGNEVANTGSAVVVVLNTDNHDSVSVTFNGEDYTFKEFRGRPRDMYDEDDYKFIIDFLRGDKQ